MIGLLSFALPFLLFILFPSRMWNFDGVACAAALELGNPMFLFHSNHLLYAAVGSLFWRLLYPWMGLRALPALQLFTSLLAAGGLMGLTYTLLPLLKDKISALLVTLCICVTAVVWVWSIEAQVYALGFLGISWATYLLLKAPSPRKGWGVGFAHAVAILGHIVHVLWIVPALYWLWKESGKEKRKPLLQYLAALFLGTVIPYVWVIEGVIQSSPFRNNQWPIRWLMGSAALTINSTFKWHYAGWIGPFQWAITTLHIFWGSFWPYQHLPVPLGCWFLTALSALGFIFLGIRSWAYRKEKIWVFSVLWLEIYGIFFWTWEPTTECYRMTDAIPLALLMVLGLHAFRKQTSRRLFLGGLFLSTLILNFYTRILPMNEARQNVAYQEIIALRQTTPDESIYLTTGGLPWIYLLYFGGCTAWDLHSLIRNRDHLEKEIARHHQTRPVFLQVDALQTDLVNPWVHKYKLQPLGNSLPWVQLQ